MFFNSNLRKISKSYYLTIFILILAFFLRFYEFDKLGFWGDEYLTFWNTEPTLKYSVVFERTLSSADLVPPFYYYILSLYNHLFEYSAYSLRLIHVIVGFLNIVLVFFISKFILSRPAINLVLFLLSINLFLIWCSTETRVVSFALFFQLLLILVFFVNIKKLSFKINIIYYLLLFILNIVSLTIHPLSIVIIGAQILFLLLLVFQTHQNKKNIYYLISVIVLSCLFYIIINIDYFTWSLKGTRLGHNQLNLNFFIGYNFKHYFTSYVLGFINLLIIFFSLLRLKNKFYENSFISYLLIIFILTYAFIILGTIFFTGLNGQKYWSYLVPIIVIINVYYLTVVKKNIITKIIIIFLVMFSPYNFLQNIDKPQVRKPDTHGLIKIFNESKINNIVSENYGMFEHYIENAYKNFNQKLISENDIENLSNDFWYLCLDLSWDQTKGSYWDDMYDCSPKTVTLIKYNKVQSIRLNGFVISKYKFSD